MNTHFAIYDRNGNLLHGPALLSTLWDGFDGPWSGHNDGDPIVLYDHLEDRWMITQFAILDNEPDYELVAISETNDPLGSWHRYAFEFTDFPDYPKLAVWPDAYYLTVNRFNDAGTAYLGMTAAALERDSMLVGGEARMVLFTGFTDHLSGKGLLPSDLDGQIPATGTPNYFSYIVDGETMGGNDRLGIYEFHVNWSNPNNSSFTGPTILTPSSFNRMCVGTRNCVPQKDSNQGLDLIGDRLMFRSQYRNFGTYQAMVTNHSVDAGNGRAGIRWYELRNNGSAWSIYQQGTYAPDDDIYRWMGSIAMDRLGNIALGYTASGDTLNPVIRYTGRLVSDPTGQMTAIETNIMASGGAQTHQAARWGDYSMMAVDPIDDASFWYTHEYIETTGSAPWRTRIASFQFAKQLIVDQQLENGTSVGSVGRWENGFDFVPYSVPDTFYFNIGSKEALRGAQNIISGEKYNKWSVDDTVINHREFKINNDFSDEVVSKFKNTYNNVEIKTNLLSAAGSDDGYVRFKDPWLIDYPDPDYGNNKRNRGMDNDGPDKLEFKQRPSPFTPDYTTNYNGDVYQGLFLEQGWPGWQPPYYSVKAEDSQTFTAHNQNITGYFLNWGGTDVDYQTPNSLETPVVFHDANAEARAVYKGHLASNKSRATGFNNGRRLVKYGGTLYMVYEDNNEIWYSTSSDQGQTWSKEIRISPQKYTDSNGRPHTFANPSIACTSGQLYTVWEEIIQNGSSRYHYVTFRKKNISGGWYGAQHIGANGWVSNTTDERPAVAAAEYRQAAVSWQDKGSAKIKVRHYNNGSWSNIYTFSSACGYSNIALLDEADEPIVLVWSQNNEIKFVAGQRSGSNLDFDSITELTAGLPSWYGQHKNPTMCADLQGRGYVAWETYDQALLGWELVYHCYDFTDEGLPIGSLTILDTGDEEEETVPKNSSVSYEQSSHKVTVFYQIDEDIYRKQKSSSSWSFTDFSSGKYPSVCANASQGAVWTKYGTAPYLLKSENMQSGRGNSPNAYSSLALKRFYYDEGSSVSVAELRAFSVNGDSYSFDDTLKTVSVFFKGKDSVSYSIKYLTDMSYKDKRNLDFVYVSEKERCLMENVSLHEEKAGVYVQKTFLFENKGNPGKVWLEFGGEKPFIVNCAPGADISPFKYEEQELSVVQPLPRAFTLHVNYPNPFNPNTTISYDLKENVWVKLSIYDVNGKIIAEPVKGFMDAGKHYFSFDGSSLSSGIYFYRLQAGNFTDIKRMLLVK